MYDRKIFNSFTGDFFVFRGYRCGTLVENGLKQQYSKNKMSYLNIHFIRNKLSDLELLIINSANILYIAESKLGESFLSSEIILEGLKNMAIIYSYFTKTNPHKIIKNALHFTQNAFLFLVVFNFPSSCPMFQDLKRKPKWNNHEIMKQVAKIANFNFWNNSKEVLELKYQKWPGDVSPKKENFWTYLEIWRGTGC